MCVLVDDASADRQMIQSKEKNAKKKISGILVGCVNPSPEFLLCCNIFDADNYALGDLAPGGFAKNKKS